MNLHEAYARGRVVNNTIDRVNNLNRRMYQFQELLKRELKVSELSKHLFNIIDAIEDLERERVCEVTLTIGEDTQKVYVNIVDQNLFDDLVIYMASYTKSLAEFIKLKAEEDDDTELISIIEDKTLNFLKTVKIFLDNVYEQLLKVGEEAMSFIESLEGVENGSE